MWPSMPPSVTDSADRFIAMPTPPPCSPEASIAEQGGDLVEHHPVDVADQPVALGRRQEARPGATRRPSGSSARRTSAS